MLIKRSSLTCTMLRAGVLCNYLALLLCKYVFTRDPLHRVYHSRPAHPTFSVICPRCANCKIKFSTPWALVGLTSAIRATGCLVSGVGEGYVQQCPCHFHSEMLTMCARVMHTAAVTQCECQHTYSKCIHTSLTGSWLQDCGEHGLSSFLCCTLLFLLFLCLLLGWHTTLHHPTLYVDEI